MGEKNHGLLEMRGTTEKYSQSGSCYLCFAMDSLSWKYLPSYIFSIRIIISRLKIRNFFNLPY